MDDATDSAEDVKNLKQLKLRSNEEKLLTNTQKIVDRLRLCYAACEEKNNKTNEIKEILINFRKSRAEFVQNLIDRDDIAKKQKHLDLGVVGNFNKAIKQAENYLDTNEESIITKTTIKTALPQDTESKNPLYPIPTWEALDSLVERYQSENDVLNEYSNSSLANFIKKLKEQSSNFRLSDTFPRSGIGNGVISVVGLVHPEDVALLDAKGSTISSPDYSKQEEIAKMINLHAMRIVQKKSDKKTLRPTKGKLDLFLENDTDKSALNIILDSLKDDTGINITEDEFLLAYANSIFRSKEEMKERSRKIKKGIQNPGYLGFGPQESLEEIDQAAYEMVIPKRFKKNGITYEGFFKIFFKTDCANPITLDAFYVNKYEEEKKLTTTNNTKEIPLSRLPIKGEEKEINLKEHGIPLTTIQLNNVKVPVKWSIPWKHGNDLPNIQQNINISRD